MATQTSSWALRKTLKEILRRPDQLNFSMGLVTSEGSRALSGESEVEPARDPGVSGQAQSVSCVWGQQVRAMLWGRRAGCPPSLLPRWLLAASVPS